MNSNNEIEVLDEFEEKKPVKEEKKEVKKTSPRVIEKEKNNYLFYFLVMLIFGIILIKSLNVQMTDYGIRSAKNTNEIVSCEYQALQFNYQKGERHWIGVAAIALGMIISYGTILISAIRSRKRIIPYFFIILSSLVLSVGVYLVKQDIVYGNKPHTKNENVEVNCQK